MRIREGETEGEAGAASFAVGGFKAPSLRAGMLQGDRESQPRPSAGSRGVHLVESFHRSNSTRVTLALDIEPQGLKEKVGEKLGFVSKQGRARPEALKEFIESRGVETGAWRGRV